MKKKMRWALTEETLFTLLIAVVGVFLLVTSLSYPAQSRLFPTLVLVPLVLGMVLDAVRAARVPEQQVKDPAATRRTFLITAGWMAALVLLMAVAGLVGAMAIFPILYMRYYCEEDWRPSVIAAAVLGVGTYVFIRGLQIPMYYGVILEAMGF